MTYINKLVNSCFYIQRGEQKVLIHYTVGVSVVDKRF